MDLFDIVYLYVIIFSGLGVYYGSSAPQWSKRKYTIVLSILGTLILFRLALNYFPKTELIFKNVDLYGYFYFYWLMPGIALLLTIAYFHMPRSRRAIYLGLGLVPFVFFFMTIFNSYTFDYNSLTAEKTKEGYYIQSTGFTCGPATGATVLKIFGIDLSEKELAIKGKTTPMTGMNEFLLKKILNDAFDENGKKLKAVVKSYDEVSEMDKKYPAIVTIKLNIFTAHWIIQLSEVDQSIKIYDPLKGIDLYSKEKMKGISRSHCIVFEDLK